ncbi:MAG: hypothetical protein U0S50_15860 [Sphingopyxis sp.]|uniref:hypothetical protein n=1 Tax=Sphingopyxis sp. TaxID=1908224 RepID=UPI002ABC529B|nr:hypothetical protein [Sphingopyxis sp.]MDZ3833272.1 hypothetical protein [Sphingopyxis sp.]
MLASEPIFSLRTVMAIISAPWTYRVSGSIVGPLYLLAIAIAIFGGMMLAAWNALLAEMREGYLSEMMTGMVAGLGFLLVTAITNLAVGFGIASIVALTIGMTEWAQQPLIVQYGTRLVGWTITSWLAARFCLAGPIMGAQGKIEPLSAFVESWRRTRLAQGRIFALYLAFNMATAAMTFALIMAHGYLIINGTPGSLAETAMSLVWLLLWGAYFIAIILIPAGLYRAAAPRPGAEVFA